MLGHGEKVRRIEIDKNNNIYSCGYDSKIIIWNKVGDEFKW